MRVRRPGRAVVIGLVALVGLVTFGVPARGSDVTGSAGTDSSLPATDSTATLSGRNTFSDMKISVNQTKNLVNQAVSVTWTGGKPTIQSPAEYSGNYVQIFQCWGDDDGTNSANPGPPPTQCAQGARNGVAGGASNLPFPPGSFATDRVLSRTGFQNYDESQGVVDPKTKDVWLPFQGVNGTKVGVSVDSGFNPTIDGGAYWQNPFYNVITTNEIAGAHTLEDGTGAELFEIVTGIENSGLGCGQKVQAVAGGGPKVPKCWVVVVPRGTPEEENADTPYRGTSAANYGVMTSPVAPAAWKNRIAFPLEFNPIDSSCDLSSDSARMSGTELAAAAIASWQPKLCSTPGLRPFTFGVIGDTSALQQLQNPTAGTPGMFMVTKPLAADLADPEAPVVYAPVTLSGLTVGFNFERVPTLSADAEARSLIGVRATEIKLTPRLLAKLLTQSYVSQIRIKKLPENYPWITKNPEQIGADPDFLQFNPEWEELYISYTKNFGGLLLPGGTSDADQQVWNYIFADPEAKKWLEGEPDQWGMKVNPVYSASASANPQGVAFTPPDSFPKSEPYCFQDGPQGVRQITPPPLCGTDWVPYAGSFRDAARLTRAADDTSKTDPAVDPPSPSQAWKRTTPQPAGRTMLSITDTPSANLFGLQMAKLSRAGDNGNDRKFIAPTKETIAAAVAGMVPSSDPAVLTPDPLAKVSNAYPLAMVSYAAIRPLDLTKDQRDEYATFLDYAAGEGQSPGLEYGQLPLGYAALPATLKTQSVQAAKVVRELTATVTARGGEEAAGSGNAGESNNNSGDLFSNDSFSPSNFLSLQADPATVTSPTIATPAKNKSALKKVFTPAVAVPGTRFALPLLGFLALGAVLGALEITKRPRRGGIS